MKEKIPLQQLFGIILLKQQEDLLWLKLDGIFSYKNSPVINFLPVIYCKNDEDYYIKVEQQYVDIM